MRCVTIGSHGPLAHYILVGNSSVAGPSWEVSGCPIRTDSPLTLIRLHILKRLLRAGFDLQMHSLLQTDCEAAESRSANCIAGVDSVEGCFHSPSGTVLRLGVHYPMWGIIFVFLYNCSQNMNN